MLPHVTMVWLAPNDRWLSCRTADKKQHFRPGKSRKPGTLTDVGDIEAAYKAADKGPPRGCIVMQSVDRELEDGAEVAPQHTNVSEETFRYHNKPAVLPEDIAENAKAVQEHHAKLMAEQLERLKGRK